MLLQTIGYYAMSDLRGTATLRFLLGLKQHDNDWDAKKRLIGSMLILWALTLPLAILVGLVLIGLAPQIIRVSDVNIAALRIALAVLLVNSLLDRILTIPMQILRAQNMDYAGMGINTLTVMTGSLLSGLVIWLGWGLSGLAVATMFNVLLVSAGRFWVARKALPWIAIKLPNREELVHFLRTSGWLFLSGVAGLLVYSSDALIVGIVLGPSISAIYVATGMVMRMIGEPLYQIVSSGNAGLVGLCGQKDWERVAKVRDEMYFLLFFFMTILGTGVIALNKAFLSLWLGADFYGGNLLTITLVLALVLLYISRIDLVITDAMLYLREKTWIYFIAGLAVAIAGPVLSNSFGPAGMAISVAIGNLILVTSCWILIHRNLGKLNITLLGKLIRPVGIMVIFFTLASIAQSKIDSLDWGMFFAISVTIGLLTVLGTWFLAMPLSTRQSIIERLQYNIPLFRTEQKK